MLIEVVCVCRRPPRWIIDACTEYAKRLPRNFGLEFVHIAPAQDRMGPQARRRDEATRLLKRIGSELPLIALDVCGLELSSVALAERLGGLQAEHQRIGLVIGGADGLGQAIVDRAQARWSLSRLTLPHLLVQVVLAEQIYRAWTILEHHPYHRA